MPRRTSRCGTCSRTPPAGWAITSMTSALAMRRWRPTCSAWPACRNGRRLARCFPYNNAGYSLIGRVIEKVTRQPFEAAMQQLVFDPLGMDRAFYFPWDVMLHPFAVGHSASYTEDQAVDVSKPWAIGRAGHPMGGVVTNVTSLLRYARVSHGQRRRHPDAGIASCHAAAAGAIEHRRRVARAEPGASGRGAGAHGRPQRRHQRPNGDLPDVPEGTLRHHAADQLRPRRRFAQPDRG